MNDGGATSSALGNILGGIAQQVGPKAAAEAALLYQQTQGADIANQKEYEGLGTAEQAANSAPGLTRTLGMNAPDPGQPSVAGTTAALSQPPSATPGPGGRISRIDESGFTPEQKYMANEIYAGRMSPAALQTSTDVFQTPLVGAGATPSAVRTRATTPLGPGQVINTTGQPGGGPTIGGGSSYVHAGDEAAGTSDIGQANTDLETGNAARASLGKVGPLVDLYNSVIAPGTTTGGKVAATVKEKLAAYFQLPLERFDDPAAAKALIKTQLLSFVGGLRDLAGNPMPRGALDLIANQIPDPTIDPNGFLASMNWVKTHLQAQANNADAAQHFLDTRQTDANAGPAYHAQRGVNSGQEGAAYSASGLKGESGAVRAPKTEELNEFKTRVAKGEDPRKLIANARRAGVDMTMEPTP